MLCLFPSSSSPNTHNFQGVIERRRFLLCKHCFHVDFHGVIGMLFRSILKQNIPGRVGSEFICSTWRKEGRFFFTKTRSRWLEMGVYSLSELFLGETFPISALGRPQFDYCRSLLFVGHYSYVISSFSSQFSQFKKGDEVAIAFRARRIKLKFRV